MVDSPRSVRYFTAASTTACMSLTQITNRDQIARFLKREPVEHAYPLGYLETRYEEACVWHGEREDGELVGLALVYDGLSLPGLFTAGRHESIRPILRSMGNALPERVMAHFAPEHRASVEGVLTPAGELRRMKRMGLRREEFIDPGETGISVDVLTHRDTGGILQLYSVWPDNFFEPYQLESGLYFGVRVDGVPVSIAGVHNVSETFDVAAIGNLVTHPDHRGKGYAVACTAVLLRTVFERVGLVTLDVQEGNEPAVRTYERFGFQHYGDFFEGEMHRR